MPYTKVNVTNVIEKKKNENEDFKKGWDESREEYRLIGEMTALRNSPSLKCFCNILNALGYELQIVKRRSI